MPVRDIHSVADARRMARRRVPRVLFDYIDGAAEDERTAARNIESFAEVTFLPRAGAGVREPDLATEFLGATMALPIVLAPCGLVQAMHPDGVVGVARAAHRRDLVCTVSTVAGVPAQEVAEASAGPLWFQLYSPGGPDQTQELVAGAAKAGYKALIVTMDTAALGNRERDVRNGITLPMRLTPRTAAKLGTQVAARPAWALGMAAAFAGRRRASRASSSSRPDAPPSAGRVAMNASPFTWDDIAAIRRQWEGPLLVKGLVTPDDAKLAVDAGADAVVVSNHGGRQLEGAPATLPVLPSIVAAVGPDVPVLLDSGIRRGSDVVKAVALGAAGVMIGRAYLYGLAAAGEAGVHRVLGVLRSEMVRTMVLLGCPTVAELDAGYVATPAAWDR
jgi:L-lactate dehydrogenase (cytochrome)